MLMDEEINKLWYQSSYRECTGPAFTIMVKSQEHNSKLPKDSYHITLVISSSKTYKLILCTIYRHVHVLSK